MQRLWLKLKRNTQKTSLVFTCVSFCLSSAQLYAYTFDTLDERTPGVEAMHYEKSTDFFILADGALVDGQITSYPPNLTTYDRTFVSILKVGSNIDLGSLFSLRLIADSRYNIRKAFEEKEPRNVTEETWFEFMPTVDGLLKVAGDLELFAGLKYWYLPKHIRTTESINFTEEEHYNDTGLVAPRFGLVKHGQVLSGGASYEVGKTASRRVVKSVSDGSQVKTDDTVYSPSVVALYMRLKLWGYPVDTEFDIVQASKYSPKTQEGDAILEDYNRIRLGVFIPWEPNTLNYDLSLIYKTISYAQSSFISIDTIPMTTLHAKMILGNMNQHVYLGLIYGQGDDTQSIPEFNARYKVRTYGAKLGANYRF